MLAIFTLFNKMMIFAGYFKKVFEIIRQEQEAISIKAAP